VKKKPLLASVFTAMLTCLLAVNTVVSSPATVISMQPRQITAPVGATLKLNITIADALNIYGWEFSLTFNATVLNAVDVDEGPFLQQAGSTLMPPPTIDNTNGLVLVGNALFPFPEPIPESGVDGNGVLATITFSVRMKGTSLLHFSETKLNTVDPSTKLPVAVSHTKKDGSFQYPLGDMNGDGYVGPIDLNMFAAAYGKRAGQTGYNLLADLDKDDYIGPIDLNIFAANYGKRA